MGNPNSVASRRGSPRRRKQFNERMVKGLFCFVLVVAFAALATALPYPGPQTDPYRPGPQNGCAAPWTQLSTGCYRFLESQMTQSEAKKFCEEELEFPAHLIEMDSDEEERAIIAEMQRRNSFSQKISWLGICQKNCAAPWTQLSTGCYRFHESPMTQSEAKKFCEEEQGVPAHLVEIDSAEENRAIIAEMQRRNSYSRKTNFWLGINDRHSEGHWVLESTGERVVFTDWKSGEPNNAGRSGSENCAFINELDKWSDVDCNGKPNNGWTRTAFCEKGEKGASLTRIRATVANEDWAGTDCAVKLILRNRDEPLTCQTMTLDGAGDSWERNQVEDFKEEDFREQFLPCKHFY